MNTKLLAAEECAMLVEDMKGVQVYECMNVCDVEADLADQPGKHTKTCQMLDLALRETEGGAK